MLQHTEIKDMIYILCLLSVVIAMLIDNIRLRRQIRVDIVTNAATRYVFENTLTRLSSAKNQFVIVYVDCDGFKKVNDEYGHKVGDQVLYAVAEFLKESVRPYDMVARIGGDEFAVLLRDCDKTQSVISRIQKFKYLGVTLSCGWATSDEHDSLAKADERMYEAKRSRKSSRQ